MDKQEVLQLDPAHVLADDNSRFNLKRVLEDRMMDSILAMGGITTPVEVETLTPATNGFTHRLVAGFYRHKAASRLNAEQHAEVSLPAIVRTSADPLERLKRQLSENMDRQDQSPMDKATAINKLLAAGVSMLDVRKMFSTVGGRKGNTVQMASNSFVNMHLSFLELPKGIQDKIHDGRVGVAAAYELTKVAREDQAGVLEAAEAARLRAIEADEREEEKFLNSQKRVANAAAKVTEAVQTVEETRASIKVAEELIKAKTKSLRDFQKVDLLSVEDKERRKMLESIKAAEMDLKGAQKSKKDAENKLAKQLIAAKSAEEKASDKKAEAEQKRRLMKGKKPKAVSGQDIKAAASKDGLVALNASEIRDALKDILKASSQPKAVKLVCQAVYDCCVGKTTPKQMGEDLAAAVGLTTAAK